MIFEEKKITLKDGRTAILKSPRVEDAEQLLNYIRKSCGETDFLTRYPEEWNDERLSSSKERYFDFYDDIKLTPKDDW